MSKSKFKKVLITGADGFIGSHLTEHLVQAGYSVRAFSFYNSFNTNGWLDTLPKSALSQVEIFRGDIRDPYGTREAIKGCDGVLHLAALIAIPFSYHSPESYVDTNIKGTLNVIQAARDLGTQKVICTSTSEVYGTALRVPIDEDHPLQGQSPYSATKIGADQIALSFFRSFDTPIGIIRPFNTYGPRQSIRAVLPTIITQIASGQRKLKLGAVHPTRDFNFVKDICRGFQAGLESDRAIGEVINLGSGFEISVKESVELISKLMDAPIEIEAEDLRLRPAKSEVERLWAANAKAKELLGWTPDYGGRDGFERGIAETIAWFRDPKNLAYYRDPQVYTL